MTYSGLTTEIHRTHQKGTRSGAKIDHIVLHHWASTNFSMVINMMVSGSRKVSANYVIKDSRIASVVEEESRSWSLSSASWDARSITFECGNSSVGGSWPLSPETHESIARVVADTSRRYNIPVDRTHILGHREVYTRHGASYATACPGGMDINWIVNRAREIRGLGEGPAPIVPGPSSPANASGTYNGYPITEIQRLLAKAGFATAIDGIYGPDTRSKVRSFQKAKNLTVDGIVGKNTWGALTSVSGSSDSKYNGYSVRTIQKLLTKAGFVTKVDGVYGPDTASKVRSFQRSQRITADGIVGPVTWGRLNTPKTVSSPSRATVRRGSTGADVRHLQAKLGGLKVDGVFGPATERKVRAFQKRNKLTVDGVVGPITWSRLG